MTRKSATRLVVDPVCKMEVPADRAAATLKFNRRTYHFCHVAYLRLFEADPLVYLDEAGPEEATPRGGGANE